MYLTLSLSDLYFSFFLSFFSLFPSISLYALATASVYCRVARQSVDLAEFVPGFYVIMDYVRLSIPRVFCTYYTWKRVQLHNALCIFFFFFFLR